MKRCIIIFIISFCYACTDNENNSLDNTQIIDCDYHIDLSKYTPTEFLTRLKKKNQQELLHSDCPKEYLAMCNPADTNWIKKTDIPVLISYLDSNDVIAIPVYSTLASITIENHGQSTLANEAYSLIMGYRTRVYPTYSSIPLAGYKLDTFRLNDTLKEEILSWWADEASDK